MLTAREFKTNYALTMKAGVDDYLTKPLDRDLLLVRLEVARRVVELNQEVSLLKRVIPLCMICHAVRDTSAGSEGSADPSGAAGPCSLST
jgi:DNA-binding response OmpR family regulator